jgi:hypothetical protein
LSDHYQTVADLDADIATAQATVQRLRDWMITQEVIVAESSDCALSQLGHAPGKNYAFAVREPCPLLLETRPNGVCFIAKRSVFYAVGVGGVSVICSACRGAFELNDSWSEAVNEWYEEKGPGRLPCFHCGAKAPITEWQHDPPFAFGNVGVEFWNWPELREDFLKALSEVAGHRVRLTYGKL